MKTPGHDTYADHPGRQGEPVAWVCELAHAIDDNRQYCDWRRHLSFTKPMVPEASIRDLRPLYAAPTIIKKD